MAGMSDDKHTTLSTLQAIPLAYLFYALGMLLFFSWVVNLSGCAHHKHSHSSHTTQVTIVQEQNTTINVVFYQNARQVPADKVLQLNKYLKSIRKHLQEFIKDYGDIQLTCLEIYLDDEVAPSGIPNSGGSYSANGRIMHGGKKENLPHLYHEFYHVWLHNKQGAAYQFDNIHREADWPKVDKKSKKIAEELEEDA